MLKYIFTVSSLCFAVKGLGEKGRSKNIQESRNRFGVQHFGKF
jgi:hypothetical protein